MCAIADVYDAITADRVYHKALPPTQALKNYWNGAAHLDQELVHRFILSRGHLPCWLFGKTQSQRLALVMEPSESQQRQPLVKVIYNAKSRHYLPVEMLDLPPQQHR